MAAGGVVPRAMSGERSDVSCLDSPRGAGATGLARRRRRPSLPTVCDAGLTALSQRGFAVSDQELRRVAADFLTAHRELYRLTPPIRARAIKVGPARPAAELLDDYRSAERRFSVPWNVLAAVNFVETKFGKLRSSSAAGAQGPMQFMPATWRRYGLGGNVHDAHDAILGAANYLHASGAPRDLRLALHHYNPSSSYVDAVLRYARRIAADRTRFFGLYNWQVFVKTPGGDRRVTGPGIP